VGAWTARADTLFKAAVRADPELAPGSERRQHFDPSRTSLTLNQAKARLRAPTLTDRSTDVRPTVLIGAPPLVARDTAGGDSGPFVLASVSRTNGTVGPIRVWRRLRSPLHRLIASPKAGAAHAGDDFDQAVPCLLSALD
jgi:hypothetical protein